VEKRFSRGFTLLASYTFSKSIDDASSFFSSAGDASFPQDSYNVRPERGRSNFDVRQRLTLSYSWELPFGRGKRFLSGGGAAAGVFGNWQTFGLWTFQTGVEIVVPSRTELWFRPPLGVNRHLKRHPLAPDDCWQRGPPALAAQKPDFGLRPST
jgi:hypothetical protein